MEPNLGSAMTVERIVMRREGREVTVVHNTLSGALLGKTFPAYALGWLGNRERPRARIAAFKPIAE